MKTSNAEKRNWIVRGFRSREFQVALGVSIVLLSLAFLGYFLYRNWDTFVAYRWRFNYGQLALTWLLYLCALLLAIGGWHSIILHLAGAGDLRLNAKIYCFGSVAGRLPGIAWDIATRAVMYSQAGLSKAVVGLASLLELVLITLAGIVCYTALMPFTLPYLSGSGLWLLVAALALGIALTHPRWVSYIVRKVKKDAFSVSLRYRDTLQWLSTYLCVWLLGGLVLYATVRSVYDLPLRYALQVIADWTLVGVLTSFMTFVPSSLGLREVTLTLLMSRYMPEHIALVASILIRLLSMGYAILWMLVSTRL